MRVYIAGKITGCPNYKANFAEAAFKVRTQGNTPVIPFKGLCGELTYKEYIDHGLELLKNCDAVLFLGNWTESKGAKLEHLYAETVGIKIMYTNWGV